MLINVHQNSFQHNLNRTRVVHSFRMTTWHQRSSWASKPLISPIRVDRLEYLITCSTIQWTHSKKWESRSTVHNSFGSHAFRPYFNGKLIVYISCGRSHFHCHISRKIGCHISGIMEIKHSKHESIAIFFLYNSQ